MSCEELVFLDSIGVLFSVWKKLLISMQYLWTACCLDEMNISSPLPPPPMKKNYVEVGLCKVCSIEY